MSEFTYRHDGLYPFRVTVKQGGRNVGRILRPARDEYRFVARDGQPSQTFNTLEGVKVWLEMRPEQ